MRFVYNLNKKWAFSKEACEIPSKVSKKWCFVNLPHTWNGIDGQDGGGDYYRGDGYYAKSFSKSELPESEKYYLEIKGANSSAEVYLNGKRLASHDGGYSTFRVDMTSEMKNENLIVIKVNNAPSDKVYPQMADFTFYGGLYRDANIICVPKDHFALEYFGGNGLKITPEIIGKDARIDVEVFTEGERDTYTFVYRIFDADGGETVSVKTSDKQTSLFIEGAKLWRGIKDPYLYTLRVDMLDGDAISDSVSAHFGCRTFKVDPERGFILNGEEYPLRGVSRHQDRPYIGNALTSEHHEEDIDLILEMGANTVRLAHYQHDSRFYDLCDEAGLVVWAEIPYISKHMPSANENTLSQMTELIVQNYNHASIFFWGLSNEITMSGDRDPDLIKNHKQLNELVYEMDKTRLTAVAAISPCPTDSPYLKIPDLVAYNHYFGWYGGDTDMNGPWFDKFHKEHPTTPIGVSEYGCEALNWHSKEPSQGDYTEEYQAYYHEELIKQLFSRQYLFATYVWNMFDFGADARAEGGEPGQNHKGLVTFDRRYKKDSFYIYKAYLSSEPFVHICGKRYAERTENPTRIKIYSNLPEVTLYLNGKKIGQKSSSDHIFIFDIENIGKSEICAIAEGERDTAKIKRVERENESYILRDGGAVMNWFDITERPGYLSVNSRIGDITRTKDGASLFSDLIKRANPDASGFEMSDGVWDMLSGFTLARFISMGKMMGLELSREEIVDINEHLNRIKADAV